MRRPRLLMVVTAWTPGVWGARSLGQFVAQAFETPRTRSPARARRVDRSGFYGLGRRSSSRSGVDDRRTTRWFRERRTLACAQRRGKTAGCRDRVVGSNRRLHDRVFRLLRLFLVLLAFDLYRRTSSGCSRGRAPSPTRYSAVGDAGAHRCRGFHRLPSNFLFVIFIALIIRGAIRLMKLFFHQIEEGKIVFRNFPSSGPIRPTRSCSCCRRFGLIVAFRTCLHPTRPPLPACRSSRECCFRCRRLGDLECDRRCCLDLHRRVSTRRARQARRNVRRYCRNVDAGNADPHHQERGHHDSQQHRPRQRDELLAPGQAGPDSPYQCDHRLRRALAAIHGLLIVAALRLPLSSRRRAVCLADGAERFYVIYEINTPRTFAT